MTLLLKYKDGNVEGSHDIYLPQVFSVCFRFILERYIFVGLRRKTPLTPFLPYQTKENNIFSHLFLPLFPAKTPLTQHTLMDLVIIHYYKLS